MKEFYKGWLAVYVSLIETPFSIWESRPTARFHISQSNLVAIIITRFDLKNDLVWATSAHKYRRLPVNSIQVFCHY